MFKISLHKSFFYELKSAMITWHKTPEENIDQSFDEKSEKYDSLMTKFHRYKWPL